MTESSFEPDVVVVGFGVAGASAAIQAHDAGSSVAIVERTRAGGGNALYAAGFLFELPTAAAVDFLDSLCFGRTDRAVLESFVAGLGEIRDWLADLGGQTEDFVPDEGQASMFPSWPHIEGGESVRHYMLRDDLAGPLRKGRSLYELLAENVAKREIRVELETRAVRLLREDDAVVGVEVERRGQRTQLRAPGGVILACGGFEGSPVLREAYLPVPIRAAVGHQANEGDGIRLSEEAGAALWHMPGFFGWYGLVVEGFPAAFPIDFQAPSFVLVDRDGRRFTDETGHEIHDRLKALTTFLPRRANRPGLPLYGIFDETTRRAGPLGGLFGSPNAYAWSESNEDEIKSGWVKRAHGTAELASAIGVDPDTLGASVEDYNAAARAGEPDDFGRRPTADAALDLEGPIYAIELVPAVATTTGGPKRDPDGRVLRADGSPVDGLYAAGGTGGIWVQGTEHGGGLTDAIVFGRKAAGHAAARAAAPVAS
jgi:succinate dehydrogenase/fumarate reductase flavoprotein subunit